MGRSIGAGGIRRQFGADTRDPLPAVPTIPTTRTLALARGAVALTVVIWLAFVVLTIGRLFASRSIVFFGEASSYLVIMTLLTLSALAYLASRVGYLYRVGRHRRAARADLDAFFETTRPTMTVLVPAYREDARVVRKTLLSAALQEYPSLDVVLLIDDPPSPRERDHRRMLERARALPDDLEELLAAPRIACEEAADRFARELEAGHQPGVSDMEVLSEHYHQAVRWLRELAASQEIVDHSDVFFAERVIGGLADDLELAGDAVFAAARAGTVLPAERIVQLYSRLVWIFQARVSSFERKQYASLSHDANKAMNLNSYIGLMGGSYAETDTPVGRALLPAQNGSVDLTVRDPDYVLTLDSDSVVLPEYCLRLVHVLEQPENARTAVAQTPYSAFPGSSTRLERIAGASTDIQHIVHQGLTYYDATFWVGANAVLRKRALEDIVQTDRQNGWEIKRFIQDRTVIEDTESSIDLGIHGWTLVNYPERLSYSATPPDFGSLCIQRSRWANGGLLIAVKMYRHAADRRATGHPPRLAETLLRLNYMASIAWANLSLILLLAIPYSRGILSPLVFAAAAPYFLAMSWDLKATGYKRLDVLRIYGFNLILLPVNLAGVIKSIGQGITGQKIAFARTPKVRDRTTAPVTFAIAPYVLVALSVYTALSYVHHRQWENVAFATFNAILAGYAILAFLGLRNSLIDIGVGIVHWVYRPIDEPVRHRTVRAPEFDWATVLHYGTAQPPPNSPPPAMLALAESRVGADDVGTG